MSNCKSVTNDQAIRCQRVTLLNLLDVLLDKGAVVKGEVLLSVANIDLVYLNLALLLASVKTVEGAARKGGHEELAWISQQTSSQKQLADVPQSEAERKYRASTLSSGEGNQNKNNWEKPPDKASPLAIDNETDQTEPKTDIDSEGIEKGLAKLVLTLVNLIRKLMEKQAIRRIEEGQLSAGDIENIGIAFLLLDEKIEQLRKLFGLMDEDLNLDLGPLGELL